MFLYRSDKNSGCYGNLYFQYTYNGNAENQNLTGETPKMTIPHQGLAEEELIDNFCCLIRDILIFLNVLFTDMFIE